MSDSVQPVLGAIQAQQGATQQSSIDVAGLLNQQAGIESNLNAEATATADAAGLVATTKNRAALDAQNMSLRIASAVGANMDDTSTEAITDLTNTMRDSYATWKQQKDDYTKQASANFFDDPLQWMGAKLLGGEEKARVQMNSTADSFNAANDRLDQVIKAGTAGAVLATAISKPVTEASIAASAQVAKFQYDQVATQAAYNTLGSNIAAIKELNTGQIDALNLRIKGWELQNQAETTALQRANLNLALEAKQDQQQGEALFSQAYVRGMAAYGNAMPDDVTVKKAMLYYKMSPQGKAELQPIIDRGLSSIFNNGAVTFGSTPGSAFLNLSKAPSNFNDTNPNTPVAKYLVGIAQQLPAGVRLDKPAEVQQAIDTRVTQDSLSRNANAESSSLSSDKGFKATITANPTLTATPFYQTVLAPIAASGADKLDAATMFNLGAKAVADGKLTIEQARDGMAQYYKTVVAANNLITVPWGIPKQTGYNAKVSSGVFAGTTDLARPEAITSAILQKNQPNANWNLDSSRWTMQPAAGNQ